MARPLRIEFAGAVYHITSRGNARENIFIETPDGNLSMGMRQLNGVYTQYSDWILARFGHDIATARKVYRDFVITGIKKESPWKDLKGGTFLGKKIFVEEVKELRR